MHLLSLALATVCLFDAFAVAKDDFRRLPGGTVTQVEALPGAPKWHLFPQLWSYTNVNISCPDKQVPSSSFILEVPNCLIIMPAMYAASLQDFEVFHAQDEATLYEKIATGDTAWCGVERLLSGQHHKCSISVTPFETTYVGVVPKRNTLSPAGT